MSIFQTIVKKDTMKKVHVYLLLAALVFIFACQGGSSCSASETETPPSTSDSKAFEAATGIQTSQDEIPETLDQASLFLTLESPSSLEVVVDQAKLVISGETRLDALLTVGGDVVEPDINGEFTHEVTLNEGHNVIEILASTSACEQKDLSLAIIYKP